MEIISFKHVIPQVFASREQQNSDIWQQDVRLEKGKFYTNGGRVLGVTAEAKTLEEALAKAYTAVSKISFEGAHYRTDIGKTK